MSNKYIIIGLILGAAALTYWGWEGYQESEITSSLGRKSEIQERSLKIGAILPLTGDLAGLGEEAQRGMELARDDSKNPNSIQIIYEDDQTLVPAAIVKAANKLIIIDTVDAALLLTVQEIKPTAPLFNNARIPAVVAWDSNIFIRGAGDYIFSNGFSTEKTGEHMAEYAFHELKLKRVAIVYNIDAWSEIISEAFRNRFTELGGEIVAEQKHPYETTDYRTTLAKLKEIRPDGVYLPIASPTGFTRLLIQAKQLGLSGARLSGDGLIQDVIQNSEGAAERAYYTDVWAEESSELTAKYKNKYNKDPYSIPFVYMGYDTMQKIIRASEGKGGSLKEKLDAIFGPSRSTDKIEKIYQVVNGKPVEIE